MSSQGVWAWIQDAFQAWQRCILRPVRTLDVMLATPDDETRLSEVTKIWVPALLISLMLNFVVLSWFGSAGENVAFCLSNWLVQVLILVAFVSIAHRMLIAFKLKSNFSRTLAMYTTTIIAYLPVLALISLPNAIRLYDAVRKIREENLPIANAAAELIHNLMQGASASEGLFLAMTTLLLQVFSIGCDAIFAESVSQWYGNNRFESYSALGVALILSTVLAMVIVLPIQFFAIYSFMKVG